MASHKGKVRTGLATAANARKPTPATSGQKVAAHPAVPAGASAAQTVALLHGITARLDALEAELQELQQCAVQQWPDGRLHLPAGNRLQVEIGNTRLMMDVASFTVEANGQVLLGSRPGWQHSPAPPVSGGVQGLAAQAGSGSNWQSHAAASGVSNPRQTATGTVLDLSGR